ncbi:class I SAM-dependent methyltransferase [Patescibacteria group bacterium]|nr:class I SAM-dependent methyltransferase [Patescibacteria group bacterium]MBU1705251.1 class I SAM-dependent methyltransferase [Patescibacteria group bacterium]
MPTLPTGRALLDAPAILAQTGLGLDMHYADFGSGTLGHFVFPATDMVGPNGQVYAVDILKGALAGIESRAKMEKVNNLKAVWGDIERLKGVDVPEHSVDLISMVNITGLLKKSPAVFEEMKRLLKPGGQLLLVDWQIAGASFGPPAEKRVSAETIKPLAEQAGFVLENSFPAGPHHWGLIFKLA